MCNCFGGTNNLTTPAVSNSTDLPTITQATRQNLITATVIQQNTERELQEQLNQQFRNNIAHKLSVYR